MPRDENGRYYSERIDLKDEEELARRVANARQYAGYGIKLGTATAPLLGPAGAVVGTTLGAIGGFILGDQETVIPVDMIAIPAYQAYLIAGTPAFQIYIKEGEVLTQVMATDAQMATEVLESAPMAPKVKRAPSAYNKAYSKAFDRIKTDFKLKSGKWAKNGFKRAVKEAHRLVKKELNR